MYCAVCVLLCFLIIMGDYSPFKNFILIRHKLAIVSCKSVTNNTLFIPSVVSVLLWVCVVVQWAVLWDQWNALCDTSL